MTTSLAAMRSTHGGAMLTQARSYQPQDGQPLGRFLHHLRTKAMRLADGKGLVVCMAAGQRSEKNKGLMSKGGGGERLLPRQRVTGRQHRHKRFGEKSVYGQPRHRAAVAKETDIARAIDKGLHHVCSVRLP